MNFRKAWKNSLKKLASSRRWARLRKLVKSPFRGNLQAAMRAWWERRREALRQWEQDDFSDIIQINSIIRDSLDG